MEKLASLENAVRSTGAYSQSKDISSYVTPISNANSTGDNTSSRPSKRIRTEGTTTQDARSPSDSVTSQLHRNGGARDHIEKELSFNESLAAHQRTVFETAIAFIDQLSKAPSGNFENTEVATWDSNVSTEFYRKDLVELVLTCMFSFGFPLFESSRRVFISRTSMWCWNDLCWYDNTPEEFSPTCQRQRDHSQYV